MCTRCLRGRRAALLARVAAEVAEGTALALDTVYCPACGPRRKSLGEAAEAERDECCVYACSACGQVCDELPF